jgi:branched-chain amino acid transport system substrate-binding protein
MSPKRLPFARWLVAIGLASVCGCQQEPIKIAFIGGLTGRLSDLGVDGRNGAQLAVEALNARGGPHYELLVHDDQQRPEVGRADIAAAVDEGAAFAIGPMTSVMAIPMAEEATQRKLVLISPTANSDELSGRDDYFFRVITAARSGAEQLATAAAARDLKKGAVLMEWRNRAYTENFAKSFESRYVTLGGAPLVPVHYESDRDPDYTQLARALLESHPRVVLLVCGAVDAAIAAQQIRRIDPDVRLAMASWSSNVQLLQLGGRALEGALVLQALDLDSQAPAWLEFRRLYEKRFGTAPGQAAVYGYEAAMLGAAGLKKAGAVKSLRDVLREPGEWPGLQQPVALDRFGDSARRFHLSEVRDGRFVMLPS